MELHCDLRVDKGAFSLAARLDAAGTRFGLFGPSGAGKTLFIRTLAGVEPAIGRLQIDGDTWLDSTRAIRRPPRERGVGWVPQENCLFPHLSVLQNLAFSPRAEPDWTEHVVRSLVLETLLSRPVAGLSGGETKRVALGRALASRPRLLLLDEPLAGLDWRMKQQLQGVLFRVQSHFDTPLVFVSHDPAEIGLFCDEVWFLREGRIEAQGSAQDVFLRPESEAVALIAGIENRWTARVQSVSERGAQLSVGELVLHADFEGAPGDPVVAMVPASEILLAKDAPGGTSARNLWTGHVVKVEHRVHGILVSLECGAPAGREAVGDSPAPLTALVTPAAVSDLQLHPGDRVCAVFKAGAVRVFPL